MGHYDDNMEFGWIACSDRMPEYDHDCIVGFADRIGVYVASWRGDQWRLSGGMPALHEINYWSFIPDNPEYAQFKASQA